MKLYTILREGELIQSPWPGKYAGYRRGKIFGRLDCKTGMRMKKENRVFFHSLEDAVLEGYRPCMNCRPMDEDDFKAVKHLLPYKTLEEFYRRDGKK